MIKYTYRIVLRGDHTRPDGSRALVLQAFIGGTRIRIPLDVYAQPGEFDAEKMQVKMKDSEKAARTNAILAKYKGRVEELFFEARFSGIPINAATFKHEIENKPALADFLDWFAKEIEKERGDKQDSTTRSYTSTLNWLKQFRAKITFSEINFEFVQEFDRYLKGKKVATNSRNKYHRVLRKFILLARKKRRRVQNPYEQFKLRDTDVERTWLDIEEVEKLAALYRGATLIEPLQRVLRHFLFQIVTSLRVSDLKRLAPGDIEGSMLIFHPKKSLYLKKIVKVPLSDLAKTLIAESECKDKTKVFDTFTEQVMNRKLKDIAAIAGIKKEITTHVARHTFGFLYILMGGAVEELREILGHSKIETTMVYTHVDYEKKVRGVKRFDNIFKV